MTLPEELLLALFVLVCRDGAQPPLSPVYDGPYRVLERSTHFFLLEMGERSDKVSTLRLKAARTPIDTEPAAAQGSPRCAGAACPRTAAVTAGVAATGDLQPSTDINNHVSVRLPASQRPAAELAQPLSLLPQSLGGTCGGVPSVPAVFPALTVT